MKEEVETSTNNEPSAETFKLKGNEAFKAKRYE